MKYRIWNPNTKKWEADAWVSQDGQVYLIDWDFETLVKCENAIVDEYLSMQDLNGKEIYQSDIILVVTYGGFEVRIAGESSWMDASTAELTVIGNEFENADLLERKEKIVKDAQKWMSKNSSYYRGRNESESN